MMLIIHSLGFESVKISLRAGNQKAQKTTTFLFIGKNKIDFVFIPLKISWQHWN